MASPSLPAELEILFITYPSNPPQLITEFMPIFCDLINADRIFVSPRNPHTRVCTTFKWRRNESIPWPAIPTGRRVRDWIVEDKWEIEDPLFRAALGVKPSIYVEDLEKAAKEGVLNIEFEKAYMFHTAFIHGHAHLPPLGEGDQETREFYGSVQPAIFVGERIWSPSERELVERCLVRIAPVMKMHAESAPRLEEFVAS